MASSRTGSRPRPTTRKGGCGSSTTRGGSASTRAPYSRRGRSSRSRWTLPRLYERSRVGENKTMSQPVLLTLVASFFWGIGLAMQKHGVSKAFPKITLSDLLSRIGAVLITLAGRRVWTAGLLLMVLGTVFYAHALAAGDLSLV